MRFGLICGAVVATVGLATAGARADTSVSARAGAWQAFNGTSGDGTGVCGVSTSWPDERYFGVKFYKGDNTITIQLGSRDWRIENGAHQPVTMQIDNNSAWNATAVGMHFGDDEPGMQFEISSNQLPVFIREFRSGSQLFFAFPNTTAADWTASLEGTNSVFDSFSKCVDAM